MRFNFDLLYSLADSDALGYAKRKFYDNLISNLNIASKGGKTVISAAIGGTTKRLPQIIFEGSQLAGYICDCGCQSDESEDFKQNTVLPCRHILAAALFCEDKYPNKSRSDTDGVAVQLISKYSQMRLRKLSVEEKIHLHPVIFTNSGITVKLYIGTRPYKVRNILDFLQRVDRRAFFRYGTDLAFFHDKQRFSDKAGALIDLLSSSYNEKSSLGLIKNFTAAEGKDSITLLQGDIDLFFEIFKGQTVDVGDNPKSTAVVIENTNAFKPLVTVKASESGYEICMQNKPHNLLHGRAYGYILAVGGIYKCTRDYLDVILPLLRTFAAKQSVFVSGEDMPAFYNTVLLRAGEFLDISGDDLNALKTPDFYAELYLNRDGEAVEGSLKCSYDGKSVDIFSDYFALGMRDYHLEASLKGAIERYFPLAPLLRIEDEQEIYNLIACGVPEISRFAEVYAGEDSLLKIRRATAITVGISLSGGLLDVQITGEDFDDDEFNTILQALKQGKSYVRLLNGRFVTLSDPEFYSLNNLAAAGGYKTHFSLPKYYAPFVNGELSEGFLDGKTDNAFDLFLKDIAEFETKNLPVPDSLSSIMRPYQKSGFRWLKTLKDHALSGILADDMGLGKSLQLIALLLSEKCFPCLIVCPSTLVLNWEAELNKFAPSLKVLKCMGSADKRKADLNQIDNYDIVITSYKLLSRDIDLFKNIRFEFAAADEAQYIKNPQTVSARSAGMINAKHRLALTGTPIENNMSELWSVFDFIMPGYLGSYQEFSKRYEIPLLNGDRQAADGLVNLTSPFILRRMKSEVLKELPAKIETDILSPLEGEQARLYQKTLLAIKQSLPGMKNKMAVLASLMRLRQICCDPRLIDPLYSANSAKTDLAVQLAVDAAAGGHKVLIFSQFTSMLEILRVKLSEQGLSHYLLRGSTPKAERMTMINRFNKDETQVFLISLRAGGTGINLTGADTVILYDPWWNNSVMNQAADRAYRLGQQKNVKIYKLIMEGSIEQKIIKLGQKKDTLSGLVVDGNALNAEALAMLLE